MTARTLVWRSLRYYWRTHLGVLLGTAVAVAVLVGALVVGDSVRYSLEFLTQARLGKTEFALASGDRFFRAQLANDLSNRVAVSSLVPALVAPVLQIQGIGIAPDGNVRANQVQVLGVDARFGSLSPDPAPFTPPAPEEAVVNQKLADYLKLQVGDEFLVRVEKPSLLPYDAPWANDKNSSVGLRVKVTAIASEDQLGPFSLRVNQVAPYNVFLSLAWLGAKLGLTNQANVLLASGVSTSNPLSLETLQPALPACWRLADAGLQLRDLPELQQIELRSDRVFLDAPVVEAAFAAQTNATGLFSYFVNRIRHGDRATPYSLVSAPGSARLPVPMRDDETVINEWLAQDLAAKPGDRLTLTYYVLGSQRQLVEKTNTFRVHSVIPLQGWAADRDLLPSFPGLAEAVSCRDWDPGMPVDLSQIRKKDEIYWDEHRGTPKAFVTLSAAQTLWSNRFGNLTAIRYPWVPGTADNLGGEIMKRLSPASLGLVFQPVRLDGLRASRQSVDFGQLFAGLSFFLVLAALLLTGLLFVFGVEQRTEETGTLLALGFTASQVRRLLLAEGACLAVIGGLLGLAGALLYNRLILLALGSVWQGAVGTSALRWHWQFSTLAMGFGIALLAAFLSMWLTLRHQVKRTIHELQVAGYQTISRPRRVWPARALAGVCLMGAMGLLATASPGRGQASAGAFFGAGSLLLAGGLLSARLLLRALAVRGSAERVSLWLLSGHNCARRHGRSLATIALLACGVFLVVAIAGNRHDPMHDTLQRASGTGGFALYAETSRPVLQDLNSREGRQHYGLESVSSARATFVPLRLREGDDASCLNLNRAQQPRLLGVRPEFFAERHAFQFVSLAPGTDARHPWQILDRELEADTIPAIADDTVIKWSLGKSLGDTISYVDEYGHPFKIRLVGGLANSIFQGSLLISERQFLKRFPSISGARVLLVDAPPADAEAISQDLKRGLMDWGIDTLPAARRLAEFSRVENTYLSIFLMLGGLGLLLGTFGLGLVVLRNVLERRGELALLRAVGFSRRNLIRLLLVEHGLLLLAGLFIGALSAILAILPALLSPGNEVPGKSLALLLAGLLVAGGLWTWLATVFAARGDLLDALREE